MPPKSLLRHIFRHGPNSKNHKDTLSHEAANATATHRDEKLDFLPSEEADAVGDIWCAQGEQPTALEAPEASRVEEILDLRDGIEEREGEGEEKSLKTVRSNDKTGTDDADAGTNTDTTTGTNTNHPRRPHSSRLTHYSSQRPTKAKTRTTLSHPPKSSTATNNTTLTLTSANETAKRAIISHMDTLHTTLLFLDALDGFSGTIAEVKVEMEGKMKECESMLRGLEGLDDGHGKSGGRDGMGKGESGMFDGFRYMG